MKIRHPLLIKALGWTAAQLVRAWMGTVRYEYRPLGPNVQPGKDRPPGRYIFALWHENLLLALAHFAHPSTHALISKHADGQLFAEVARRLGFGLVRGSTGRHGIEAVRQMLRLGEDAHLALAPDGPRGPRRQVQPGLIYLAARSGLPIVVGGIGYRRPWRVQSWDRFAVPKPWSYMTCITSRPISVPSTTDSDELERYRLHVENTLRALSDLAESWAETGIWPGELDRAAA